MKKILFFLFFSFVMVSFSFAQSPNVEKVTNEEYAVILKAQANKITEEQISNAKSKLEESSISLENFDFDVQYITVHENSDFVTMTVNSKANSESSSELFGFSITYSSSKNEVTNVILSKIIRGRSQLYYFADNSILDISSKDPGSPIIVTTTNAAQKSCGQKVMDCITDAYTNNGWVSVWGWIQTAFIPQTAVAVAAACYINACGK